MTLFIYTLGTKHTKILLCLKLWLHVQFSHAILAALCKNCRQLKSNAGKNCTCNHSLTHRNAIKTRLKVKFKWTLEWTLSMLTKVWDYRSEMSGEVRVSIFYYVCRICLPTLKNHKNRRTVDVVHARVVQFTQRIIHVSWWRTNHWRLADCVLPNNHLKLNYRTTKTTFQNLCCCVIQHKVYSGFALFV